MIESQIICDFRGTLIDITCANGHGRQKGVHLIEEKLLWIPAYDLSKSEQQILSLICLVVLLSAMTSTHFSHRQNRKLEQRRAKHAVKTPLRNSHFYQRFAFHISTSTASFKYVPAVHTSFTPVPALCLSYSYQHCVIQTCTSCTHITHTSTSALPFIFLPAPRP